jgi:hypothetical protein
MLVIGVAEPENPNSGPEAESQRQHDAYEESIGRRLDSHAKRCIEMVGLFGIHGLRQRILVSNPDFENSLRKLTHTDISPLLSNTLF